MQLRIRFEDEKRRRGAVLRVMSLALMMVVAGVAGLNVALPEIARDTGASQTELQWIVDAYALAFAALLLPAGAIGDRFGRKPILMAGLGLFGLASGVALFVDSPGELVGVRVALGVAAAFIMPVTLSVITTVFPPEERGKAVGTWAGVAAGGAVVGLLASGVLLEWFSWQSIFALNVVLATVALAGHDRSRPPDARVTAAAARPRRHPALGHRAVRAHLRDHRRPQARVE
jgi:MFS family permease